VNAFYTTLRKALLLMVCLGALAGCGNKGDLYLPGERNAEEQEEQEREGIF